MSALRLALSRQVAFIGGLPLGYCGGGVNSPTDLIVGISKFLRFREDTAFWMFFGKILCA